MTRRPVEIPESPAVQILGQDTVLLRGRAAIDAYSLMVTGLAVLERRASGDGIGVPVRMRQVIEAVRLAQEQARTSTDMADVRESPTSAVLVTGEVIGIKEVARMTGRGERQARRLAAQLGGVKTRSGWRIDRGLVQAHIEMEAR